MKGIVSALSKLNGGRWAEVVLVLCATTAMALAALTPAWAGTFTTLHQFDGTDGFGRFPGAGLVQATDGDLYGTTSEGGAHDRGTVFRITPSGTLTTLHSFDDTEGNTPFAVLVQATDGDLYGTTLEGGAHDRGTVFRITPSGTLTTLHSFDDTEGELPYGTGLVQATDGNFYGTTSDGGTNFFGTVFRITPGGTLTTLHSFDDTEGNTPDWLVQATGGNFYGTTAYGGDHSYGTVFRITRGGTLTTLHSFDDTDGNTPDLLIQATDGNFYGTTDDGGAHDAGTVFKITPNGMLTTLHSFDGMDDAAPNGLIQATNGKFYGTTRFGGVGCASEGGCGKVFSLSVGLGPFVRTLPTAAQVGIKVTILGTNLAGATSVKFNGTPAVVTQASPSEIQTTVPTGATTGTVKVVTPGGTLSSNVPFRVL
jgi:uncharacterized repeat protein (TIGR03803 family)